VHVLLFRLFHPIKLRFQLVRLLQPLSTARNTSCEMLRDIV
jgi:hypothetical protein